MPGDLPKLMSLIASTISCLVGKGDFVFSDRFNHASIKDGCRFSGAEFMKFRHNDINHLDELLLGVDSNKRKLVVVDGVFSMDGDIANLPQLAKVCDRHDALLMVDEAHSIGVIGNTGRGIEEHFGMSTDSVDVKMGTLSKSIPSVGGYIASSKEICNFLRYQARGFIYSAALPPTAAAAALAAIEVILEEPESF